MDVGVGVESAASAVERAVQDLGDAVAGCVETPGGVLADALGRAGPVGRWLGGVGAGILNVVGVLVSGAAGIIGGVPAGALRLVGGIATLDRKLVGRGATGIASSVGGAVLLLAGTTLAALQRVVGAERPARPLTPAERVLLRGVFERSVALRDVRLVEGRSGAFGANGRPFTLGNTIYLKDLDLAAHPDVLVHEVVHVWQYQHEGPRYATDALGAQVRYGWAGRGAYDWEAEVARGRTSWGQLNKEAQGSFVQELWASGSSAPGPMADDALRTVRARRSWRLSSRIMAE